MKITLDGMGRRGGVFALVLMTSLALAPACGTDPDGDDGGTTDAGGSDGGTSDGGDTDGGATDGGGATALTWTEVEADILSGCAGGQCHGAGNTNGLIELGAGGAYSLLVGVASMQVPSMSYIEPGFPADSFVYRKLEGTHAQACTDAGLNAQQCGVRMPRNGPAISAADLEGLRLWIEEGAAEN